MKGLQTFGAQPKGLKLASGGWSSRLAVWWHAGLGVGGVGASERQGTIQARELLKGKRADGQCAASTAPVHNEREHDEWAALVAEWTAFAVIARWGQCTFALGAAFPERLPACSLGVTLFVTIGQRAILVFLGTPPVSWGPRARLHDWGTPITTSSPQPPSLPDCTSTQETHHV
jgi:hypothetical protein